MSVENIQVLPATPDDILGIRRVQKITWLNTYPNKALGISVSDIESRFADDDTKEGRQKMEERKQRLNLPHVRVWVAKENEEVVGFVTAVKEEKANRVGAIYLLPNYQGSGVGGQLMRIALHWLGSQKNVYVNVVSYNQNAIGFYERFGFVKTGKTVLDEVAALPSGAILPEIEMVREQHE